MLRPKRVSCSHGAVNPRSPTQTVRSDNQPHPPSTPYVDPAHRRSQCIDRRRYSEKQWHSWDCANGPHPHVFFRHAGRCWELTVSALCRWLSPCGPSWSLVPSPCTSWRKRRIPASNVRIGPIIQPPYADLASAAAEWRNDPRNPYAAELAKSSLH